jgi:transcriptional regulator with XRE-family HTH domain
MLGDRIRTEIERLRVVRGWSRAELGRRIVPQTSGQQVERLEKGMRQLDTDWIEKIARAFSVDPAALVAGEDRQFELTPQVADEVAHHLARIALRGDEPDPAIVQVLSILLQELSETFVRHPQARRDPEVVRPVIGLLAKRHGRQ